MSFFHSSRGDAKPTRTTGFGDGLPTFGDVRSKLHNKPDISERFRNFSPSAKKSGEEILQDLKEQLRREGDMFFSNSPPDWSFSPKASMFSKAEDGEDLGRRGMDDLRGRHGMFRMPGWMSEDDDMSDLAHRMSHAPHFATMGRRGGPWRERRSSGGSAMSATSEDDSCDAGATDKSSQCSGGSNGSHEIPIRFEAPAPPSMMQQQPQQQHQQQENEPVAPLRANHFRKNTQYPVRTTSAVDASERGQDVPRGTRCASAPPEVADQPGQMQQPQSPTQQRFVSKINITPQAPQSPSSPQTKATPFSPLPQKFNTVPKPFVAANKPQSAQPEHQPPTHDERQHMHQQPQQPQQQPHPQTPPQYQQQPQYQQEPQFHQSPPPPQQQQSPRQGGQRPSIVRNIPIFVEGRDGPLVNEESSTPPKAAPQWGQQFHQSPPQPQPQPQSQPQPQPQPRSHSQQRRFSKPQQPQPEPIPVPVPMPAPASASASQQQSQPIPVPVPMPAPTAQPPQPQPQAQPKPKPHAQQQPQPQPQPQPQAQQPQPQPQAQQPEPQQPPRDPRLSQIEAVKSQVDEYRSQVEAFSVGTKKDRSFLYLDEMLTRCLLQLDNVDPSGRDDVRQARRAVIKDINAAISLLESKASDKPKEKTPTPAAPEAMQTEPQEQPAEPKEGEQSEDKAQPPPETPSAETEKPEEVKMETTDATSSSNEVATEQNAST